MTITQKLFQYSWQVDGTDYLISTSADFQMHREILPIVVFPVLLWYAYQNYDRHEGYFQTSIQQYFHMNCKKRTSHSSH